MLTVTCPRTKTRLRSASKDTLSQLRTLAQSGELRNLKGDTPETLTEVLVSADGAFAYEVRQGIPILLPQLAISLREQLKVKAIE